MKIKGSFGHYEVRALELVVPDVWGASHICTLTSIEHAAAVVALYESTYDCDMPDGRMRSSWDEATAIENGWIE